MGTRGLYCAVLGGEFRIAQYGQWDAYPSGQGEEVYSFTKELVDSGGLAAFKEKVSKLRAASPEDIEAVWKSAVADGSGLVGMDVSAAVAKSHPEFQRDLAAGIFRLVNMDKVRAVDLRQSFASDGLFCEWAYVLDLDNDELEVHKGGRRNASSVKGRFSGMKSTSGNDDYGPVIEVASFSFTGLPPDVGTFVQICEGSVLDRLANLPPV